MGNYVAVPSQKKKNVCGSCLTPAILDRDELAIHKEVGVPKGRLCLDAMKFLNSKERSLMVAASGSNTSQVQKLIKSGAPADTYDENRTSPLHIACRHGSIEVVQELIDHRASIDITDCAGWTSLHIASYACRPDIVKLLLKHGGDATIVNRNGQTPWDLAADSATQLEFINYWKQKTEDLESPKSITPSKTFYDIAAKKAFPTPFSPTLEKKKNYKKWDQIGEYKPVFTLDSNQEIVDLTLNIFNRNPYKGLALMILIGIVAQNPKDIAMVLHNSNLSPSKLGIILSESDLYYSRIAEELMGLINLNKSNLIISLRKLLKKVKLPIEKNHASNLIKCFAKEFWSLNSHFKSNESVESICLSIIMLDFSLHDHTSSPMSKSEFITSTAGMHDGEDFSEKYLSWVYEEVKKQSIRAKFEEIEPDLFTQDFCSGHLAYKCNSEWKERYFVLYEWLLWGFVSSAASTPYSIIPLSGLAVHFDTKLQIFTVSNILPFSQIKITENGSVFIHTPSRIYFKAGDLKPWLDAFQAVPNIKLIVV